MKFKPLNTISLTGLVAVALFLNTSTAYAETIGTFNNWDDLQNAITVEATKAIAGGHPEEMGIFLIEPGSVIEAKDDYLYAGTFTGTLNGGTGDGLANINGLTKPLFNILGAGAQITGLQLTTSTEDKDGIDHAGDGYIGITGQGILANISDGAKIENVRVGGDINYGSFLSAGREVSNLGGLIGEARNTEIKDSTFSGNITSTSDNVGGLVGYLENSTITNSTAKVTDLKGDDYVGGLVGKSFNSTITAGMTVGLIDADSAVGGIVGSATSTVITNSLSKTLIKATGDAIGGLVGELVNYEEKNGEISASVFKGGVIASGVNGQVGGIVGLNYGTITDASSIPLAVGINGLSKVGGVVGSNVGGLVTNSYFDGLVTSEGSVGGIAGSNGGTIENSAASGEVVTKEICLEDPGFVHITTCAGILVGFNNDGTLRWSASTTSVAGNEPITNAFAFYLGEEFPKHYLTYLNKDYSPDRWALDICYNNNRPFLNSIKKYFSFDCWSESDYPEKIFGEFITYIPSLIVEYAKEVAEIKGFEPSLILPSDSPLKFLNKLDQKDLEKIFTSSFDLNTIREISLEKELPIQLEVKGEIGASAQVWVQTPDGSWINLGLITFDEEGNAILPALKFADLGNYKLVFFTQTENGLVDPSTKASVGSINIGVK